MKRTLVDLKPLKYLLIPWKITWKNTMMLIKKSKEIISLPENLEMKFEFANVVKMLVKCLMIQWKSVLQ